MMLKKWLAGFAIALIVALVVCLYQFRAYLPARQPDVLIGQPVAQLNHRAIAALPITKIRVYKAQRYLDLLHEDQVVRRYPIRLGFNPVGHKAIEGDGKTPEGSYQIDWRNANSSFYKSLHISYPNQQDTQRAHQLGVSAGGDIMIHGSAPRLGAKGQPLYHYMPGKDWTLGCIAVSNAAMDDIWQLVKNGTTIEIVA
jgi:murein L,D-transpeptidase YafK